MHPSDEEKYYADEERTKPWWQISRKVIVSNAESIISEDEFTIMHTSEDDLTIWSKEPPEATTTWYTALPVIRTARPTHLQVVCAKSNKKRKVTFTDKRDVRPSTPNKFFVALEECWEPSNGKLLASYFGGEGWPYIPACDSQHSALLALLSAAPNMRTEGSKFKMFLIYQQGIPDVSVFRITKDRWVHARWKLMFDLPVVGYAEETDELESTWKAIEVLSEVEIST